jgi:ubiquinone/menaquinone biosynthesis C-methylase UbiE
MKAVFNWVMRRRARELTARLRQWLRPGLSVADVGSGSGHNAACWRAFGVEVDEFDVADLHWVGAGPTLWDGSRLPCSADEYDVVTLLFVLHYVPDPRALLQELRRICSGRVVVLQSTYRGRWGRFALALREFVWGRTALLVARLARLIRSRECPLRPRRCFTREELRRTFGQSGFRVISWEPDEWQGMNVSRDLYVLEATHASRQFPSSSRPATKCAISAGH